MYSVILFNNREMTYAVVGMNYSNEEAVSEVNNLKKEGGFHVNQEGKTYSSEKQLEARMKEITKGRVTRVSL